MGKFRTVSSAGKSLFSGDIKSEYDNKITYSTDSSVEQVSVKASSYDEEKQKENTESPERSQTNSICTSENEEKISIKSQGTTSEDVQETISVKKLSSVKDGECRTNGMNVEIKQESVNYIGYYSSHEQLMQQLMMEQATSARHDIREMVTKGMVHCRTHLLWNRLVSHPDLNQLTYGEFMELRTLTQLENITQVEPTLKLLLDQPFSWYQGLSKLILAKYSDQHRLYVSPDGNTQHLVILHPRYNSTFIVTSVDLHTSRGVSIPIFNIFNSNDVF